MFVGNHFKNTNNKKLVEPTAGKQQSFNKLIMNS